MEVIAGPGRGHGSPGVRLTQVQSLSQSCELRRPHFLRSYRMPNVGLSNLYALFNLTFTADCQVGEC